MREGYKERDIALDPFLPSPLLTPGRDQGHLNISLTIAARSVK